MFDNSHCFYRLPEDVDDRLDVLFNDTLFDVLELSKKRASQNFIELDQVVNFKRESRNPEEYPDDEFVYVDIGSVNLTTGKTNPEIMLGKDATSSRVRRVIHKNEILVSTTRPTRNAICIVPDELDNQICSTGFAVLETKGEILSKFLFYSLRSDFCKMQFERYCSGSGYPAINQEKDLPKIVIPKVDEKIQKQILGKITSIEIEAEKLEKTANQIRNDANNSLLIDLKLGSIPRHFNYFFKTGMEEESTVFFQFASDVTDRMQFLFFHPKYAYLENLKEKYEVVTLDSIIQTEINRGEQVKESENGVHLLIKTAQLKNGFIDFETSSYVTEEVFNANPKAQVKKGDILIASTGYGSLGKVDVYDNDLPALVDGHISIIRVNSEYDPYFVTYYLRSNLGQLQVEKWWTGSSGQIELPSHNLDDFIIISKESLPLDKQNRIAKNITEKLFQAQELEKSSHAKRLEAQSIFDEFLTSLH
jgi:type I restriction enzyme S subunit